MEVARKFENDAPTAAVSLDDHIQRWRRIEGEVEDRMWKLAEVASSVVGLNEYGAGTVPKFAEAVGHHSTRIYQLSSVWKLRVKLFGAGEILKRSNGLPLTISHFVLALSEADPERVINESIALSLSTSELQERAAERNRERGRKALRETVGAAESSSHIVRKSSGGNSAHPGQEDTCASCGGFLIQATRLGRVAEDLGVSVAVVSEESGVSEDLIGRMISGEWVNQQMGMRVAEAMQKRIAKRERKQW